MQNASNREEESCPWRSCLTESADEQVRGPLRHSREIGGVGFKWFVYSKRSECTLQIQAAFRTQTRQQSFAKTVMKNNPSNAGQPGCSRAFKMRL
jgi:hypothetical protein